MERFRKINRTFLQQLFWSFSKKNVIAGYLLGIFTIIKTSISYYSLVGNHTVNLAESYVLALSDKGTFMILLTGCIIVMADAPFLNASSFSLIHRVGRKLWYMAMWLYMIVSCGLYYLILFIVSLFPFLFNGYIENAWSQTMFTIAKGNAAIMADYGLVPPNSYIMALSPYETLFHAFLCSVLYVLCLSSVLLVFNMKTNKRMYGTVVAGGLHIISFILCFDWMGGLNLSKWSLFKNAIFSVFYAPKESSNSFTYCYFVLVLYFIYMVGECLLPHISFMLNSGGQDE